MIIKFDVKTAALTLGIMFALCHFVWVVLVQALGNTLLDLLHNYHFVQMTYAAMPFDAVVFVTGLVGAFVVGAITGAVFALIWNKLAK